MKITTKRVPATCFIEKLFCGCGAEMKFHFTTKKPEGIEMNVYACPDCAAFGESEVRYPRLVWEET